jgi:hypothetical protein
VEQAQYAAACHLSRDLAAGFGVRWDDVFDALTLLPDNMLDLLHSPEGWTALASYVAADMGMATPQYRPEVH